MCVSNLKFLASTVSEIWTGSENFKSRSRDPFATPVDLILHFFSLVLLVIYMYAKFEVSSFKRFRDMEGVPEFQNFMTPLDHFSRTAPVVNLSVKFDANIFIGDRYMAIFTTSPIWL